MGRSRGEIGGWNRASLNSWIGSSSMALKPIFLMWGSFSMRPA